MSGERAAASFNATVIVLPRVSQYSALSGIAHELLGRSGLSHSKKSPPSHDGSGDVLIFDFEARF
jgi:hypothetical protein